MKLSWSSLLAVSTLFLFACGGNPPKNDLEGDAPLEPRIPENSPDRVSSSIIKLHLRDFGATPESTDVEVWQALEDAVAVAAITNAPVELLFEPNATYRITLPNAEELRVSAPGDTYAFHVENATNLTINGQGAMLVVTDPNIGAICLENSSQVELKNFRIDYDPLPFTQGTITQVNHGEYWFEMKLDDGYPEPDTINFKRAKESYFGNWGLTIRDEGNGRVRYGPAAIFTDRWEKTGDRLWRFFPSRDASNFSALNNPLKTSGLKTGDTFVYMARNWSQAVAAKYCDHILWEGITIHTSPGLDFYPRGTSHHTIRDCHVKPREGRIFSATSDGIHARGIRGPLLIENCSFDGMADDGINVHSSALSVKEQPATNQFIAPKHTYSVRPGDRLRLVRSETAAILMDTTVTAVEDLGAGWKVTVQDELPELATGKGFGASDNFYNLSESASPFIIRNCHFKNFRGRGVLVSAHNGIIENCTFEQPEGWSVVLHYESTRWAEGPLAYDLTIRNNTFRGKGSAAHAAIQSEITARVESGPEGRPFHNILIEGNRFLDYAQPVMNIHHVRNVTIRDNRVFCSAEAPRKHANYAAIELFDCENISIEKLAVEDPKAGAVVKIAADCGQNIKVDIGSLKLGVAEIDQPVLDLRNK